MTRIGWAAGAIEALDHLIRSHSLPADTRERIKQSLRPLGRFPRIGPEIARLADDNELRFIIGPWPWLVIVYLYDTETDAVIVVSAEDGRSAGATIARRPQF